MRVGLTFEGRGVFGDVARASRREGAVISSSMSLGCDKVRVRLNGEPDFVGVVGRLSEIEGREACRLGLGIPLYSGEKEVLEASS
jgi:hypothetical protein